MGRFFSESFRDLFAWKGTAPRCFPWQNKGTQPTFRVQHYPPEVAPNIAREKLPFGPNRKPDRLPLPAFFRGKLAVKLRGG